MKALTVYDLNFVNYFQAATIAGISASALKDHVQQGRVAAPLAKLGNRPLYTQKEAKQIKEHFRRWYDEPSYREKLSAKTKEVK